MVRVAPETAVRASISTPVLPVVRTVAVISMALMSVIQAEVYLDVGKKEGMAHGDEVGGILGGHDAGDAGDGEDLALGDSALGDELEGLGLHGNEATGDGFALSVGLGADVDHPGPTLLIDVAEVLHIRPFPNPSVDAQ